MMPYEHMLRKCVIGWEECELTVGSSWGLVLILTVLRKSINLLELSSAVKWELNIISWVD